MTVVVALASKEEPLSAADLEPLVPGVPVQDISKILSVLHTEQKVRRVTCLDEDRAGVTRNLYKYWVDA